MLFHRIGLFPVTLKIFALEEKQPNLNEKEYIHFFHAVGSIGCLYLSITPYDQ